MVTARGSRRGALRTAIALLALLPGGCGEPLNEGAYRGDPLFMIEGNVESLSPTSQYLTVFASVAWANWLGGARAGGQSVSIKATGFPAKFRIDIFEPPPAEALADLGRRTAAGDDAGAGDQVPSYGQSGRVGMGVIVAHEEIGDLSRVLFRPGQDGAKLRGVAPNHVVIYNDGLNAGALRLLKERQAILNPEALRQGYNLARGVCAADGSGFDSLLVVAPQKVQIEAIEEFREKRAAGKSCIELRGAEWVISPTPSSRADAGPP